ncbi:MAG: hypothetical protein KF868_07285 [Acidobacteria bacterium]|nr:hypothetical protein [Acidobacteriota bacterium]MCW5967291.1 hypothetical protein [Blastocatellales bacterium]
MTQRATTGAVRKLHSIHFLAAEREFRGSIELGVNRYKVAFIPASVAVTDGKLEITGDVAITGKGRSPLSAKSVRATLASVQAGIGAAPPAPARFATRRLGPQANPDLPRTEATDATGFAGTLYFHLSPINRRTLGIPVDMSRVQMNLRLAPTSQTERELQWLFSAAAAALLGTTQDQALAREYADEIQRLLTS